MFLLKNVYLSNNTWKKGVCQYSIFKYNMMKIVQNSKIGEKKNSELVMKQDLGETDRHWERSVFLKCGMVVQSKETKTMWE